MVQNKAVVFKEIPDGVPKPGKDLVVETSDFDTEQAPPSNGFTAKLHYVSLDPYQRGRMRDPKTKSYFPAYTLGEPITNSAIATVLKSSNPSFKSGDIVRGMLPIAEYAVVDEATMKASPPPFTFAKVENPYNLDLKHFLASLGMPGLTAYSSFYEIGKPKKGETIFISAASGAVGQLVGQLAKHEGLTVIGSVGSQEKLDFITKELGFDSGFNYKEESTADALARLAPKGIDIYYENVGGETLDAVLEAINAYGRIILCGMISQYSKKKDEVYGPKNLMMMVGKRVTMEGFLVGHPDMGPKHSEDHVKKVSKWVADGTFKTKLHVDEGIDNFAEAFVGLLSGKNFGKAILKVSDH